MASDKYFRSPIPGCGYYMHKAGSDKFEMLDESKMKELEQYRMPSGVWLTFEEISK